MEDKVIDLMKEGFETAFVDQNTISNLAFKPEFISNNYNEGQKVVASIENELLQCDQFYISVAFITMGGLTPLLQTLKQLDERDIPGQILTTDYLTFSQPDALRKISKLKNIELRMFCTDEKPDIGFHTKGYIFKKNGIYSIIVGSSNVTLGALTRNREWNTKLLSTENGEYASKIINEYSELWNSKQTKPFADFIDDYSKKYAMVKIQKEIAKNAKVPNIEDYRLTPNKMQVSFINNLDAMQHDGKDKALLISATGTGKTYASAFAVREQNPKKTLFVVHREQIAKQAMKSYKKVLGEEKSYGLLSGTAKDYNTDLLFSTMQMMSKKETLERFSRDEFDTIIIDEVHRAGAESYQRIMDYFRPKFWLGMTASPDRMDGFDIYNLFDHNIAYEIRLQQALEENMLCPFHYFGIKELNINGEVFDDNTGMRNFNYLVCDDRVDYIIEQAQYYGHSGDRVKGLIFCSRKKEAEMLANKFNERKKENGEKYKTVSLSGEDSQEHREECIDKLVSNDSDNYLDYIITVDIFNEGVDIPEINQVIMLRPTESPIVFVQQLGRGLRKADNKEYVVIIDFIGNYTNNFMIPIALSGDRTYNKDNIRRHVMEGSRIIPGSSTIHFDEVSKERIFESIDKSSTKYNLLKEKYISLKNKIGRIPSILDFYEYGEIDPKLFIECSKTYDAFVRRADEDYTVKFNDGEEKTLEFVSNLLIDGKRPHELILLKMLIDSGSVNKDTFKCKLNDIGEKYSDKSYNSALNILTKDFSNQTEKDRYKLVEFFNMDEIKMQRYSRTKFFLDNIKDRNFLHELENLISLGLKRYEDIYFSHDENGFTLYQKYSRKDVCRLLNWKTDEHGTIFGYKIKYNTCPIFVTYEKDDSISSSTKYEDEFINSRIFSWMTRSRVKIDSKEPQAIINYKNTGLKIMLFVKKSDDEGSDFYYMGEMIPVKWEELTMRADNGKCLPVVNFKMELKHEVRKDIYDYFQIKADTKEA